MYYFSYPAFNFKIKIYESQKNFLLAYLNYINPRINFLHTTLIQQRKNNR